MRGTMELSDEGEGGSLAPGPAEHVDTGLQVHLCMFPVGRTCVLYSVSCE